MKNAYSVLIMTSLSHFFIGCFSENKSYFAAEAPQKAIQLPLPFPSDLTYQASPLTEVLIGIKKVAPATFKISGYGTFTGKRLWQLGLEGEIVGQTQTQLLIYIEKSSTVHFIDPQTGKITQSIHPAPSPLNSKTGIAQGMAFTNDMYLTTKGLYTQIVENGKTDDTFKIGITAQKWSENHIQWFLAPVTQIIDIQYKPIIKDDKVLIINPQQSINKGHSYQIVELTTGKELSRSTTEGTYYWLSDKYLVECTATQLRMIEPFTQQTLWQIKGNFKNGSVSAIGHQVSIMTPSTNKTRQVCIVNAFNGNILQTFQLPYLQNTRLEAAYLTKDKHIWLHFLKQSFENPATYEYDYWVQFDPISQKAQWQTHHHSESLSSLVPFLDL